MHQKEAAPAQSSLIFSQELMQYRRVGDTVGFSDAAPNAAGVADELHL
jgi:hypothetical protein